MSMPRIVIIGASGHGGVALDAAQCQGKFEIVGWLDSNIEAGRLVGGLPILGKPTEIAMLADQYSIFGLFLAISDNWTRHIVWQQVSEACPRLELVSIVHPGSIISKSAQIGPGALVLAGAIVNCNCRIGTNCIINTKATLDHDSEMKSYSSILPGVTTGGGVVIGEYSCICIGAILSHQVKIGAHAFVGAGAVVLGDIPNYVLAFGTPAHVVRNRKIGEHHL
jgi:sugar O-acyltransferase (sialic acid O-acetyltransferase NeuD family)